MDDAVEMAHLSWPAYRDRVGAGAVVLLPVGALEQHGHHLPLGVDAILATEVARRVARRVGGIVAPAVPYGYKSQPRTGGGEGFPGTTGLDAATLIAVVHDVLVVLARRGARRLAVVDGHYENELFLSEAVDLAMRDLAREGIHGVRILKLRYFDDVEDATIALLWPDGYPGMALEHAALMETSMMLHVAPDLVDLDAAPDEPAATFPAYDVYPPDASWIPSAGALSSPARASAAFGEHLMDRFVDAVASAVERELG